jgi:hypothetical protein
LPLSLHIQDYCVAWGHNEGDWASGQGQFAEWGQQGWLGKHWGVFQACYGSSWTEPSFAVGGLGRVNGLRGFCSPRTVRERAAHFFPHVPHVQQFCKLGGHYVVG